MHERTNTMSDNLKQFTDDEGNTFNTMDEMLAFHGLIFTKPITLKRKPKQYVFIDEHGKEIIISRKD